MGLDWYWLVSYLLEAFPELFLAFFSDFPQACAWEFHVQGFVLVLVEVDQGICFFRFHVFFTSPFSLCGGCVVFPLFLFSVSFCIYFFCFGVCAVGLCVPGTI